jgi:hypothetical protein
MVPTYYKKKDRRDIDEFGNEFKTGRQLLISTKKKSQIN